MTLRQNLLSHLKQVVRDRDPYFAPTGHLYVREYVREQLAQWGTVEVHEFEFRGGTHQNLVLHLPAQPEASKRLPIVIGAHYDAVPGVPGADDNASGLVVLLEMAQAFAKAPCRHPIQIVAFDLEEMGLIGSKAYAQKLHQQGQKLRLMLSLEMLGYCDHTPGSQKYPAGLERFYPDRGDFIGLIGNVPTLPDLIRLSRQMRTAGNVPCEWLPAGKQGLIVPETRLSDHAPFWDLGYRAMMITDTSFMRNPHYHRESDRLDTLDLDFLTGVCQGLIAGVRSL
ncbi:peptidase M28 [filamentous cyanobacterium CCP2]|nr:peptidase M28 [filamentous cyanobacterium CCP2]